MNNQTKACPACGAQYDSSIGLICCPVCAAVLPGSTSSAAPAAPTPQYSAAPQYTAPSYAAPTYSAPQYGTSAPVSSVTCGLCGASFPSNLPSCPACGNLAARTAQAADISGEQTVAVAASGAYSADVPPAPAPSSVPTCSAPTYTVPAASAQTQQNSGSAPGYTAVPTYTVPAYTARTNKKDGVGAGKGVLIFIIAAVSFAVIFLIAFGAANCSRIFSSSSSSSSSFYHAGKKPEKLSGDDQLAYDMLLAQIDYFPKPETVRMIGGSLGVDKDCLFCYLEFEDEDGDTQQDYFYIDKGLSDDSGFILPEDQPYSFYSDTEELDIDAINDYLDYYFS